MTAPLTIPPDPGEPPTGFQWVAQRDDRWRVTTGRPCRANAGYRAKSCRAQAVAELNRGYRSRESWWAYCPDHLYGRWVQDGAVWAWVLEEAQP